KIFRPSLILKSKSSNPTLRFSTANLVRSRRPLRLRTTVTTVGYSQDDSPHTRVADGHTQLNIAPANQEAAVAGNELGEGIRESAMKWITRNTGGHLEQGRAEDQ
ncbi:hypothetical protein FRB90_009303, partial [Tulasnella sp. 427]